MKKKHKEQENNESVYHNPETVESIRMLREDNSKFEEEERKRNLKEYIILCIKYFFRIIRSCFH